MSDASRPERAGRLLLRWFRRERRDLPWRGVDDPYRIWVSEVMLQQTRVAAALGHYGRFLERFPTVHDLAAAHEDEVLSCWSGLGYYGRARSLHRAASLVCGKHGGEFPRDEAEARALPGVGPYTAAAVLSIAYGEPLPVLDGNVIRVVARLFGVDGDPARAPVRRRMLELASRVLGKRPPGEMNQALMELGSQLCTPRSPGCGECPLSGGTCVAEEEERQEELPRKRKRPPRITQRLAAALLWRGERVLLVRGEDRGLVRGLWEPPWVEVGEGAETESLLAAELRERYGIETGPLRPAGSARHSILNRDLRVEAYRGAVRRGPRRGSGARWFEPRETAGLPRSSLVRKLLSQAD